MGVNLMATPEFWVVLVAILGVVWLLVKD
jgi:hypothetical protein